MSVLLTRLGKAVLLPRDQLLQLAQSAPHRYKVFQIPKRTPGQFRTIAQPAREVKALQYWVMKNVLKRFDVHPGATAYCKELSIADNARPHASGRFLLKMDFKVGVADEHRRGTAYVKDLIRSSALHDEVNALKD
jgi:RNA-directed DNA polymerase